MKSKSCNLLLDSSMPSIGMRQWHQTKATPPTSMTHRFNGAPLPWSDFFSSFEFPCAQIGEKAPNQNEVLQNRTTLSRSNIKFMGFTRRTGKLRRSLEPFHSSVSWFACDSYTMNAWCVLFVCAPLVAYILAIFHQRLLRGLPQFNRISNSKFVVINWVEKEERRVNWDETKPK